MTFYAGCQFAVGALMQHRDTDDRVRARAWIDGKDPEREVVRQPTNQAALRAAIAASDGEMA